MHFRDIQGDLKRWTQLNKKNYLYFKRQSSRKGKKYEDNINMHFRDIQGDSKRWTQLNKKIYLYFKRQSSRKGKKYEDNINMHFRDIQGDSKRWTQLKTKRRLNTSHTVGCGIPRSLLALRVDLRGLRS